MQEWTREYCGVTHLGELGQDLRFSAVRLGKERVLLEEWFPGCGLCPKEKVYPSMEEAKKVAERRMRREERRE